MKHRILIGVLALLIIGYALVRALAHVAQGMSYEILFHRHSPDHHLVITALQSRNEGAHAPYGQHLVLAEQRVTTPEDGHVVFAGYCKRLSCVWTSPQQIRVSCEGSDKTKTLSVMVRGIEVEFNEHPSP